MKWSKLKKLLISMAAVVAMSLMVFTSGAKAVTSTYSYTDPTNKIIQDSQGQQYFLAGLYCGFGEDANGNTLNSLDPSVPDNGQSPIPSNPYCEETAANGAVIRTAADAFWINGGNSAIITIDGDIGAAERPPVSATSNLSGPIAEIHTFSNGIRTSQSPIIIEKSTLAAGPATSTKADFEGNCRQTAGVFSWLICPMLNGINKLVGNLAGYILDILETPPLLTNQTEGQNEFMYTAWKQIRTIANIMLVPIFMFTIYSFMTGTGNRYTLARILPRLVIATILMQFSFYIAAIIIDIGNVLAAGIAGIFNNINAGMVQNVSNVAIEKGADISVLGFSDFDKFLTATPDQRGVGAVFGVGMAVLAVVLFASAALPALPVMVLFALLGILVAFVALALRQLAIVMLVVLSPFAFLMGVLPATEKWMREWFDNLGKLILIYPLFALIFSASSTLSLLAIDTNAKDFNNIIAASLPIIALISIPALFVLAGRLFSTLTASVAKLRQRTQGGILGDLRDPGSWGYQQRLNKLRRRSDQGFLYSRIPGLGWTTKYTKPHRVARTMYNLGGDSIAGVVSGKFPDKMKRIFWGDKPFSGVQGVEGWKPQDILGTNHFKYDSARIRHNRAELTSLAMGEMAGYIGGHFDRGYNTYYGLGQQALAGNMPDDVAEEAFMGIRTTVKSANRHLGVYEWNDLKDPYVQKPQDLYNLAYGDYNLLPQRLWATNLKRKKDHIAIGSGTLTEQQSEGSFKAMADALKDDRVINDAQSAAGEKANIESLVLQAEKLNYKLQKGGLDDSEIARLGGDEEVTTSGFYGKSGNEIKAMREFIQSAMAAKRSLGIDPEKVTPRDYS